MNRNEIKISFSAPRVYVDVNNKSSKCGLFGVLYIPKEIAQSIGMDEYTKVVAKSTAVCQPCDVFDETKARKIAVAKAEAKMYSKVSEKLVRQWDKVNDEEVPEDLYDELQQEGIFPTFNSAINAFWRKAQGCVEHNMRYIEEIAGE